MNPVIDQSVRPRGLHAATYLACACLFLLAPWVRGGNRHVAMAVLESVGLLVLVGLAYRTLLSEPGLLTRERGHHWRRLLLIFVLSSPLWITALQLAPVWNGAPLTTTPQATVASAMVGVLCAICMMVGLSASHDQARGLMLVWITGALLQACIGLLQLGGLSGLDFGLISPEKVRGTFASKNSFANFLAMTLPLACLFGLHSLDARQDRPNAKPWLWSLALIVMLAALFASVSRTGIATGVFVLLLSIGLLAPSRGHGASLLTRQTGVVAAAALLVLGLMLGGLEWLSRFDIQQLAADSSLRAINRESAWQGALDAWPFGVGLGGFEGAFPRYQAPELGLFLIDMAHNDYLQWLMDAGASFVVVAIALAILVVRRLVSLAGNTGRSPRKNLMQGSQAMATAAGLGLLAIALHSMVDYPARIPANAMLASFLMGLFLRNSRLPRLEARTMPSAHREAQT